jgi:hypothetical protein
MVRPYRARLLAGAARYPDRASAPQLLDPQAELAATQKAALYEAVNMIERSDAAAEIPIAASGGESDPEELNT